MRERNPYGVHLRIFLYYCVLEKVLTLSKSRNEIGLFQIMKMFYPPEGLCRAEPKRGTTVFTYVLFGVWKGTRIFKITTFRRPFWNPENVLSPGGTLRRAEPEGGPIVFTLDFIGVDYHTAFSKSPLLGGLFEILKMFCDTFLVSPPPLHTLNSFKVWNRYHILFLHLEGNHW